ncbi:cytochrome c [Telluribacter sp.]|jgi:mono/diheme cytochrome c family protein|uniref:cytochrome c n=1 Tax=Telluribacter sp. TaxID=1978767 RepID=UPI002E13F169|nr:cytochrome c [Telluribacter sp.]
MLRKLLTWTGIALGSVLILLLMFYAVAYFQTEARINKIYEVQLQALEIPDDSANYALGKHVAEIRGCTGCHGADLSGGRAFADPTSPIGTLYASNITHGIGGINYTDQDWLRVLRHGINKDFRSVWFMPSHEVYHISNKEMAALISYLRIQAPVDKEIPAKSLKPLGRVLTFLGEYPLLPAEMIDHNATYADDVPFMVNADYGKYLATTCQGCHSPTFKGAAAHGPNEPDIPDISSTGNLGKWDSKGFVSTFRTGKTPDGRVLSEFMPVKEFPYSDQELEAIYAYLHQQK